MKTMTGCGFWDRTYDKRSSIITFERSSIMFPGPVAHQDHVRRSPVSGHHCRQAAQNESYDLLQFGGGPEPGRVVSINQ